MMAHEPIPYELTADGADYDSAAHPVDSTYYPCCNAIGQHARTCTTIAAEAVDIAERIRHVDPGQLHNELTNLCESAPAKAAQILMAFAAWFDLDITAAELRLRAEQTAAEQTYHATEATR